MMSFIPVAAVSNETWERGISQVHQMHIQQNEQHIIACPCPIFDAV